MKVRFIASVVIVRPTNVRLYREWSWRGFPGQLYPVSSVYKILSVLVRSVSLQTVGGGEPSSCGLQVHCENGNVEK